MNNMKIIPRLTIAFIFYLLPIPPLAAITVSNFHSDIIVKVNRSFEVRETLSVNVEGTMSPNELYRNIPVQLLTSQGIKTRVKLIVSRVLVDGISEPFIVRNNGRYKKIFIESPDHRLQHGMHTFVFEYNIADQVRFFDNYDEIFWNITGTNPGLTIQNASAKIIFPSGIEIISSNGFTGYKQSAKCDCNGGPVQKSIWEGYITEPLYPSMGWGITIRFTGGYILPVTREEIRTMVWKRNRIFYAGMAGVFIIVIFYVTGWIISGRDNKNKRILPRHTPPDGFNADLCRYLYFNGYDSKTFTALIIQLAVKGGISILKDNETFILKKARILPANLDNTELGIITRLFKNAESISLEGTGSENINSAFRYHEKVLKRKGNHLKFRNNLPWLFPGIIMSLLLIILMNVLIFIYNPETYDFTLVISIVVLVLIPAFNLLIDNVSFSSDYFKTLVLSMTVLSLFFLLITTSSFIVVWIKDTDLDWVLIPFFTVITIFLLLTGLLGSYVIRVRTGKISMATGEMAGLRQYLSMMDTEKLALINRPAQTVRHFESLLPYAVGLDAESNWARKFEPVLNQAISSGYPVTTWYNGNIHDFNGTRFSNEIRYSLQFALISGNLIQGLRRLS